MYINFLITDKHNYAALKFADVGAEQQHYLHRLQYLSLILLRR